METKCADCVFFVRDDSITTQGQCRRYAPRPAMIDHPEDLGRAADWPVVFEDHWCGEYQPRKS